MTQLEIIHPDIRDVRALQEWLRTAWRRLGDPALTALTRRELREQMKECSADLKARLQTLEAHHAPEQPNSDRPRARPELRIVA